MVIGRSGPLALLTVGVSVLVASTAHSQSNGFVAFGVSSYSTVYSGCGGGTSSSTGGDSDATEFHIHMVANGWSDAFGAAQQDSQVNDIDFFDPDVNHSDVDIDTVRFDPTAGYFSPNVAISYYAGHGLNTPSGLYGAGYDYYACTYDSDCPAAVLPFRGTPICTKCPTTNDAGVDEGYGHDCLGQNFIGPGVCRYAWDVTAVVHGPNAHHCNKVDWGSATDAIRYGESVDAGAWAGGGTNGGTNMVVFHQSFGGTPGQWGPETQNIFAGLHLLGMTSPTSSDTNVAGGSGDLGNRFARQSSNPNSVVGEDFVASVATVTAGAGCPQSSPNPSYAKGGYDSCGCDTVISWDVDLTHAAYHVFTETWSDLQSDSTDAKGTGYYWWLTQCNYDLSTYKFSNPRP